MIGLQFFTLPLPNLPRFALVRVAVDAPTGTVEYRSAGFHHKARGGENMDDEQWLATADDAWRRANAEHNPFRRHTLVEETAAAVVRGTSRAVRAYCLTQTRGDAAHAADLAQQTYLIFWRTLPRFEGRSSLKTFVLGIANNVCRQATRDGARASAREAREAHNEDLLWGELAAELGPRPDDALVAREQQAALRAALTTLDHRDTWLLWARVVDQQSYAEMLPAYQGQFGAHIATPEGLRTAVFHAKRRLLAALEGGGQ
jgi:RNA polymerase sigma-70 factor (ECF subfamily)